MFAFFWPTKLNATPGTRGWIGRAVHYAAMLLVGFLIAPAAFDAALSAPDETVKAAIIFGGALGGFALLFAGRYVRHRLAHE
jgi:hypothetical protein